MCFIFSLIPATIFTVIGYFVLFSSTKAEGAVQKFGQILAIWVLIVALFFPIMGLYVTLSDLCPMGEFMESGGQFWSQLIKLRIQRAGCKSEGSITGITTSDNDLRFHLPFKADPHLLQNLSSFPAGSPQLGQNLEGEVALAFAWWVTGPLTSARRAAVFQTKKMTRIITIPTIATMGQLLPSFPFDVEGNAGSCTPGGAELATDNWAEVIV